MLHLLMGWSMCCFYGSRDPNGTAGPYLAQHGRFEHVTERGDLIGLISLDFGL